MKQIEPVENKKQFEFDPNQYYCFFGKGGMNNPNASRCAHLNQGAGCMHCNHPNANKAGNGSYVYWPWACDINCYEPFENKQS